MNEAEVSVKNTKRGRPATNIEWPNEPFTVEDVNSREGNKLSKVAIQLRVKKAVDEKTLVIKGKQKTTGRPRVLYVLASNNQTPESSVV